MSIIYNILIFIFGAVVGSFLNCVAYRVEKEEGFVKGRSYCPKCKHNLSWLDLIPIFSFLSLRGKCRYCKAKISWRYPLAEISIGLLFLIISSFSAFGGSGLASNQFFPVSLDIEGYSVFNVGNFISLFYLIFVSSLMALIFIIDLKHFIIPDKILFPAIIIAFLYMIILNLADNVIANFLISAIIASGFFLAIILLSKGKWMGMGDAKLAVFMGLFLGFPNILVAMFFAFTIGAIIGLALISAKKKSIKSEVPFGPFLISATFIAFFWGQAIVNWYMGLIGLN